MLAIFSVPHALSSHSEVRRQILLRRPPLIEIPPLLISADDRGGLSLKEAFIVRSSNSSTVDQTSSSANSDALLSRRLALCNLIVSPISSQDARTVLRLETGFIIFFIPTVLLGHLSASTFVTKESRMDPNKKEELVCRLI
ncbi:hypothetical protein QN277_005709 [Acacia crassicarpa]|uniref:Uncharacterized protein n=1 Tax=Acacia crassicarpa TaxID=499986 RepID=A0AAE1JU39_9FABA|nr:hypothetical protein QN277_005709 [Acacia crassicarpa]